jgi:hypothetical protein
LIGDSSTDRPVRCGASRRRPISTGVPWSCCPVRARTPGSSSRGRGGVEGETTAARRPGFVGLSGLTWISRGTLRWQRLRPSGHPPPAGVAPRVHQHPQTALRRHRFPALHPILTTDYFEFGTSTNHLGDEGCGVEMGDAVLGPVAGQLGAAAPRWLVMRNVSDRRSTVPCPPHRPFRICRPTGRCSTTSSTATGPP